MIELTTAYADSLAPNSATIKNAQGLVQKNKFASLHHSDTGDLLFGECQGSGSSNYRTSADFAMPEKPVFRCTCPSRQFPCKHSLGLLYAYIQGKSFTAASVPDDLAAKREKAEKREEKKQEAADTPAKPKKVNKSALLKKIKAQLEGLDMLDTLVQTLISQGLGTLDQKSLKTLQGQVKELGNFYLSGAQNELRQLALLLSPEDKAEPRYAYAIEQLTSLHAMVKKGRTYLEARLDSNGDLPQDTESELEEWLGHAWQLADLKQAGMCREHAELLQLAFTSYDDPGRQEYVDVGFWLELGAGGTEGSIHRTLQYRPYKAARHIREDDSFLEVVQAKELYTYPGGLNRRVRFEEWTPRSPEDKDWQAVAASAHRSYTDALKLVRNQLKNPLADRTPALLLHADAILHTDTGEYALQDAAGTKLALSNTDALGRSTIELLGYLEPELRTDVYVLVLFRNRPEQSRLAVQPLTLIKGNRMIRLLY